METDLINTHKNNGKFVKVGDTNAFVYDKGTGVPVVCFHGVPASSFLYRKLIAELSDNGLRGISFDLLGMGLSDRPSDADYSWTGLGEWSTEVIKTLNLGKFHVVLHDIGGPVGCEVISRLPEQILSVTVLNTLIVDLPNFKKPFPMGFFSVKLIGELFLALTFPFVLQKLMHLRGIHKNETFTIKEASTYIKLLKGDNKGKTFLKIMRSFEATKEKERLYVNALNSLDIPKQIVWGINDKGLPFERYGKPIQNALKIKEVTEIEGSHFLQEDYVNEVSAKIIDMIKG